MTNNPLIGLPTFIVDPQILSPLSNWKAYFKYKSDYLC